MKVLEVDVEVEGLRDTVTGDSAAWHRDIPHSPRNTEIQGVNMNVYIFLLLFVQQTNLLFLLFCFGRVVFIPLNDMVGNFFNDLFAVHTRCK